MPINLAFENVKFCVLTGSCTRSLHQIRPGKENNEYLVRPLSCFCSYCKANEFNKCKYKEFTKGNFTCQKLPSNELKDNDEDWEEEEEEDDEIQDDDNIEEDDLGIEIKIAQEKIEFENLEVGRFIIAIVEGQGKITDRKFVAIIKEIKDVNHIYVEFLQQQFDNPDIFKNSLKSEDKNCAVGLDEIVMFLPKPLIKRSKYFFSGPIFLSI